MCDTFVALGNAISDGSVVFGKNGDREPNEAHELLLIPHVKHKESDRVSCAYIGLSQIRETSAVLPSKPFWIWGAEMGANEHGLVIGNEACVNETAGRHWAAEKIRDMSVRSPT